MKTTYRILLSTVFVLMASTVSAYDFIWNNLCYNYVTYDEVQVVGCYATGDVDIPQIVTNPSNDRNSVVIGIGSQAFYGKDITSVYIPTTVTYIGAEAFRYCGSLETASLPDEITTIGGNAFYGCTKLTSIVIPKNVTSLDWSSFDYCPSLNSITVHPANRVYDSRDNCNAIIETATNRLIKSCNSTVIPQSVISIGEAAFQYSKITAIDIPNGVTEIGNGAFRSCNSLTTVKIPASVSSIGTYAFASDKSLVSVTVERREPIAISENVFSGITADQFTLYVPSGCKSAYKAAAVWSRFTNIVEMENDEPEQIEVTDISQMENVIYIEPTEGLVGTTIDLCVKMKNTLTPVGCSFKLALPEGLRLQTDEDGDVVYTMGNRARKMSVTMKDWEDGTYDFALTPSTATATISGNDDTVITFHVQLPDDMAAGDYKLKLTKCLIQSKVDGTTTDYTLSDVVTTLTVEDYVMGDVNGDRHVTPSDAIMTLYHYFNVEQTGFNVKAADVNGDGNITPADAIETLYMYFEAQ